MNKLQTQFGEHLDASRHLARSAAISGPGILWMLVLFLAPLVGIAGISFASRGAYGELQWPATFDNYKRLLGFGELGFDPVYPMILVRSVVMGAMTAILCVLAGLPLAFFIARQKPPLKTFCLTLVVIPFWTNLLIRTYAWQILLSPQSWLSKAAAMLGIVNTGDALYPGFPAIALGMLCDFLPFMALPLYVSVEKIDWSIAEAAMDLGADRIKVFWHAILPQIRAGLSAGLMLVFLPATGQFVIPDLLGGARTVMLGNLVQQQFGQSRDWPFGAAISVTALVLVVGGMAFVRRVERKNGVGGVS